MYDFVVSELTSTIPDLSPEAGADTYGRVNQWAARGILARVYLNAEVYTGTPRWNEVLTVTQEIMDASLYSLESEYRAVFARNNDASNEILWAAPYDEVNAPGSNFHMKTLKPELRFVFDMQAQPWGGSASNPQFIDTYDLDDTRLNDTWLMGPQFDDQGRGYEFVQHVPSITDTEFNNGFPVWKYEVYAGETGSSDVDYPLVRYAEVLMMRAEALLGSGDAGGAAALVTQVQDRAFADTDREHSGAEGRGIYVGIRHPRSPWCCHHHDTTRIDLQGQPGGRFASLRFCVRPTVS